MHAAEHPFIVYAMPRSRTAWLSAFLSHDGWTCEHDGAFSADSLDDVCERLKKPKTGMCETGFTFAARAMYRMIPKARVAVVRRKPEDVATSLRAKGWQMPDSYYSEVSEQLDRAANIPGAITVKFEDLDTEDGCKSVYEHCLQQPFDSEWWKKLAPQNIQTDLMASIKVGRNRQPFIDDMHKQVDEVMAMPTVQNEPWDDFFRDAQELFKEHYAEAGPIERLSYNPNFALAAKAYKWGFLQITTARSRGKLVGYLICQIEHHLEDKEVLRGIQIPWFISKPYRGPLAFKMHRFMRQSLAERGCKLLHLRSGVRGVGRKQDAFFKRLGAREDGHNFLLPIGEP